jgi:hypothetical protein
MEAPTIIAQASQASRVRYLAERRPGSWFPESQRLHSKGKQQIQKESYSGIQILYGNKKAPIDRRAKRCEREKVKARSKKEKVAVGAPCDSGRVGNTDSAAGKGVTRATVVPGVPEPVAGREEGAGSTASLYVSFVAGSSALFTNNRKCSSQ